MEIGEGISLQDEQGSYQGSNNRPSPVRLDRFVTDSGITASIPTSDTRRSIELGGTRYKLVKLSELG